MRFGKGGERDWEMVVDLKKIRYSPYIRASFGLWMVRF